jgi:hypothetical protein
LTNKVKCGIIRKSERVSEMIKLYTYDYEKDHSKYLNKYRQLFNYRVGNKEKLDATDISIIKKIDSADYIGNNTARNKNGDLFGLEKLSTGAKIVLVVKWYIENKDSNTWKFDITSCGDNALDILIDVIDDKDVELITCNYSTSSSKEADILVNDKHEIDSFGELPLLGGALYEHKD